MRKTAITAPDGKRYILLVLFDVTGKNATEERLRESEQRFRSLTELSADWYWEQDDRYRYTYSSDSAAGHMVETGSELIGRTRFEAEFDWPSDQAMRDHRATLDARRPFRDLVLRSRKTGRWGLSSGEPVFDAGGAFKGYRGVGRDITDLKTVEEQLRESANAGSATSRKPRANSCGNRTPMAPIRTSRRGSATCSATRTPN
ncbi:MAG: PAS domain S-box protein [Betaproteobacteria bacterium]|nr:PAS domain S-box protein [Betaproteobacteria bacterium]